MSFFIFNLETGEQATVGAKNKNEPSRRLLNIQTAFKRGAIHNRKIPRHKKWVLEWVNSMCQVGPESMQG